MGDPKRPRKKFSSPRNPWSGDQLARELYLVGTYGLRNKKELWKAQTELSNARKQARTLLAAPTARRLIVEPQLLGKLMKLGMIGAAASLDDVLTLTVENVLERRLQTLVWRKGLATSPYQARQMINHGHINIGDKVVTIPSYRVRQNEEPLLRIKDNSSMITKGFSSTVQAAEPTATAANVEPLADKVEAPKQSQ